MKRFSRKTYLYPFRISFHFIIIIINCPFACTSIFKRKNYFNSDHHHLFEISNEEGKQSLEKNSFDLRWIELSSKASRNPTIWSNVPAHRAKTNGPGKVTGSSLSRRRARFLPSAFQLSIVSTEVCLHRSLRAPRGFRRSNPTLFLSRIKIIQRDHFLSIKHPFLRVFPIPPK